MINFQTKYKRVCTHELLQNAAKILEENGIKQPLWEAEQIMASCLRINRWQLYYENKEVEDSTAENFIKAIYSRMKNKPLQYVTGEWEFMGIKLMMDSKVFIPRPETELLADTFIKKFIGKNETNFQFADIGTGSGNIAIVLAIAIANTKLLPSRRMSGQVWAVDISEHAINLAKNNAKLNNINNITFLKGNLLEPFYNKSSKIYYKNLLFNGIAANLPYIPSKDIAGLPTEVSGYEPHTALDGGTDGMDIIKRLITEAPYFLRKNGYLGLEVGIGQAIPLKEFALKTKNYSEIELLKDFNDIDRIIMLKKNG